MTTKYKYNTENQSDGEFEIKSIFTKASGFRHVAEECAEDYYRSHDGWEDNWPITIYLWTEDGKKIGVFETGIEAEPEFHARFKGDL